MIPVVEYTITKLKSTRQATRVERIGSTASGFLSGGDEL
jgi:hypothetical protein